MVFTDTAVSPPLVTPFDADGAVDTAALASLVERCVDAGLDGLVPCGTTGEFASLTDEEWATVVETTADTAGGDVPVIAGVAHTSVAGARERIARAADLGADAGLLPMPYFHTANDEAGTEAFLRAVADDSPLPLVLYNIPSCTGAELSADVVAALADHESVVGLKDSGGDFGYFLDLGRRLDDEFILLQGFDDLLVPGMALGGDGGINALAQAIPEAYVAARDAAGAGNLQEARRVHDEAIAPLFDVCYDHGFAPVTKTAVAARGWIPRDTLRPPLVGLDDDAVEGVEAAVDRSLSAV